jgi:hypothetical protein
MVKVSGKSKSWSKVYTTVPVLVRRLLDIGVVVRENVCLMMTMR